MLRFNVPLDTQQAISDIITTESGVKAYLAASYCLTVSNVSSIVLLHRVFKLDVKKFNAPTKHVSFHNRK